MDRIDKIVARNMRPAWYRSPVVLAFAIAIVVVVMIVLAALTSLGRPHRDEPPPPSGPTQRLNDVLLRHH